MSGSKYSVKLSRTFEIENCALVGLSSSWQRIWQATDNRQQASQLSRDSCRHAALFLIYLLFHHTFCPSISLDKCFGIQYSPKFISVIKFVAIVERSISQARIGKEAMLKVRILYRLIYLPVRLEGSNFTWNLDEKDRRNGFN